MSFIFVKEYTEKLYNTSVSHFRFFFSLFYKLCFSPLFLTNSDIVPPLTKLNTQETLRSTIGTQWYAINIIGTF